ncbi:MAG: DMT family transporter [Reyranella sp.]|uniref:DMT family transporter n=1 Tax=Reyranella sp. TaxID=1929291 RepID=UPI0012033553|nr:DMT family transporter [Reyranella sp.]TAJ41445.1 MAG: DMT family transporter [Reyranella sp.]
MIDNTRGILAMSAAVVVFIFNDALIKIAAETVPAIQAIGVRGVFATLWVTLALAMTGAWRQLGGVAHPYVLLRGALEAASSIVYLVALFHIQFAIATAINLSTPLIFTALAVLLLKETVRWRRWSAVILGFLGVLLVIQPRPGDIDVWAWVVLFATVLGAFRDVLGRYLPASVPTLVVSFASAAAVALVGCAWTFVEGWQPMTAREIGLLLASSLLLAAGYQFLVIALRSGAEFSVIGSFRYASILWALGIGYVVWGDVPNALALFGIVVIVGSGLYILHRERVRR